MKRGTLLARQISLPARAAIAVGLLACGAVGASGAGPRDGSGAARAGGSPDPLRTMDPGTAVTLVGGGHLDSEDGPLSCRWRQTAGTLRVTLRGADTCAPEFDAPNAPEDAVPTFTLTATDAAGVVRAAVDEGAAATLDGVAVRALRTGL